MDKLFWNVYCLVLDITIDGGQFKVPYIYQQLLRRSILEELVVVIESLEIKPFLFGNVGYASWITFCIISNHDGDLNKIIFN
jgi:hypothetical protein